MKPEEKPLTPARKFAAKAFVILVLIALGSVWLLSYWMGKLSIYDWQFLPACITAGVFFSFLLSAISVTLDNIKGK